MPDNRRSPSTLLVLALALPVIAFVYASAFGGRVWAALRPAVATLLGATVIGSIYAEEAYRRAPATPMRAGVALALAVALVGPGVASPRSVSAANPAEAVVAAAREYLGTPYRLGTEGPKTFDCSGFIYRVFSDVGELPRVGGLRLKAAGYMRWFTSRGLFSRTAAEAEPGDLVVWDNGKHIGIYLGGNKAISALVNPWGITVHSLHGIGRKLTQFLHVNWRNNDGDGDGNGNGDGDGDGNGNGNGNGNGDGDGDGDGDGNGNGNGNGNGDGDGDGNGDGDGDGNGNGNGNGNGDGDGDGDGNGSGPGSEGEGDNVDAQATGTMNLRRAADPSARIIGWVGKGGQFKIIGRGNSPAGYLWYQIRTKNGKEGWLYSRWVQPLD